MTVTTTTAAESTIVDRIPAWATTIDLGPDGYVLFAKVISDGVEIQQCAHLVVDQEAGTVSYQPADGLQLWIPDIDKSVTPAIAREMLGQLQELLAIVDALTVRP